MYRPFDSVIVEVNITELSSTQLSAFMHIKMILVNMVPLPDQTRNLRLEEIYGDADDEELDFQVILLF